MVSGSPDPPYSGGVDEVVGNAVGAVDGAVACGVLSLLAFFSMLSPAFCTSLPNPAMVLQEERPRATIGRKAMLRIIFILMREGAWGDLRMESIAG